MHGAVWRRRIPELLVLLAASATQLRSLELNLAYAAVTTAQVDAMVLRLPSLQHLAIRSYQRFSALSALFADKRFSALSDGFPVNIAGSCRQLRHLEISGAAGIGAVPPQLAQLSGLTRLVLADARVTSLPSSISALSALHELDLNRNGDRVALPSELAACRQLTRLGIAPATGFTSPVLARLQHLRSLRVGCAAPLRPGESAYWTQLTALSELEIAMRSEPLDSAPAGLSRMTGLRKLSIEEAGMHDLPAGPYRRRLESLKMQECVFHEGLPASLAALTQLRHVEVGGSHEGFFMSSADVVVLSSLPALSTLHLARPQESRFWAVWQARLGRFREQCIAQGRAPPVISEIFCICIGHCDCKYTYY